MSLMFSIGTNTPFIQANDIRNCDQQYHGLRSRAPTPDPYNSEMRNRADNAYYQYPYATRWWPKHSVIMGGWIGSADDTFQNLAPSWIDPWTRSGANGRLAFVGYTRDPYGSVLGGCTVRLFRTVDTSLQSMVTSDANGLYFATTPFNDAHFEVIHNAAGNLAGATRNDLLPS